MNTTEAAAHRVRQARRIAWHAELALTAAQLLFWVSVIGAAVGLIAWMIHRLTRSDHPSAPVTPAEVEHPQDPSTTLP